VPATVTLSPDSMTVTLTPSSPLFGNTQYSVCGNLAVAVSA